MAPPKTHISTESIRNLQSEFPSSSTVPEEFQDLFIQAKELLDGIVAAAGEHNSDEEEYELSPKLVEDFLVVSTILTDNKFQSYFNLEKGLVKTIQNFVSSYTDNFDQVLDGQDKKTSAALMLLQALARKNGKADFIPLLQEIESKPKPYQTVSATRFLLYQFFVSSGLVIDDARILFQELPQHILTPNIVKMLVNHSDPAALIQAAKDLNDPEDISLTETLFLALIEAENPRSFVTLRKSLCSRDIRGWSVTKPVEFSFGNRVRGFLHQLLHRREGPTLFKEARNTNPSIVLPAEIQSIASKADIPLLYLKTKHRSEHLETILHDGRILPKSLHGLRGFGTYTDFAMGDQMLVCTSPDKSNDGRFIKFNVATLMSDIRFSQPHGLFFRLFDFGALAEGYQSPRFEIMPGVTVHCVAKKHNIVSWVVDRGTKSYTIDLPMEAHQYRGFKGLNYYQTFFLFQVFTELPDEHLQQDLYAYFKGMGSDELVRHFRSAMHMLLEQPEIDFVGPITLNFEAVDKVLFMPAGIGGEADEINFDRGRSIIREGDLADFQGWIHERGFVFDKLTESFFLVSGMLKYAQAHDASAIADYIKQVFPEVLSLIEENTLESKTDSKADPSSKAVRMHLVDPAGEQQLVVKTVVPTQVNHLVEQLAQNRGAVVTYIKGHPDAVQRVIQICEKTFGSIKETSSIGLVSMLIKKVVSNHEFQALISDPETCKTLLYLAALKGDVTGLVLPDALLEKIRAPVFEVTNSYTGTSITAYLHGMINQTGIQVNRSILADLLMNVPPQWLFVPRNAETDAQNPSFNSELIEARATAYANFFVNLHHIATESAVDMMSPPQEYEDNLRISGAYDYRKWREYKAQFQALESRCEGYSVADASKLKDIAIPADIFINSRMVLNSYACHNFLDPAHLRTYLGQDCPFRDSLYSVMDTLEKIGARPEGQPPSFSEQVTGLQLYRRLELLKYELAKSEYLALLSDTQTMTIGGHMR